MSDSEYIKVPQRKGVLSNSIRKRRSAWAPELEHPYVTSLVDGKDDGRARTETLNLVRSRQQKNNNNNNKIRKTKKSQIV